MKKWCAANGDVEYNDALLSNPELKQAVYDSLIALANSNKLNSLEKPKQIQLIKDPFTTENGYLTPTMKLKRNIAKERHAKDIDTMYNTTPVMAPTKK